MPPVKNATWSRVGDPPPRTLADARLQVHHAAQIIVSAAISYVAPRADDSHSALTWMGPAGALATESITAERDARIALRLDDLSLHVLDGGAEAMGSFGLPRRTTKEAYMWLTEAVGNLGLEKARLTPRKHYTIPDHPVAGGAPFSADIGSAVTELARYWSNAAAVLDEMARVTPGASVVRTWPHHFDIATLIVLPENGTGGRRTIGVGQSPGDDSYAEPYWYVGPYPYPTTTAFPPVAGSGRWHTEGWVGAVLPASDFVAVSDQQAQVGAFVESGIAACRILLGG
jgi:hypothetical protein